MTVKFAMVEHNEVSSAIKASTVTRFSNYSDPFDLNYLGSLDSRAFESVCLPDVTSTRWLLGHPHFTRRSLPAPSPIYATS